MSKPTEYKQRRLNLMACDNCPSGGPRTGAKGNPDAPFVIIGESPGREEVIKGVPLIGASGKAVFNELPEGLWNEEEPEKSGVYILNAMQCLPNKTLKSTSGFMNKSASICHGWVHRELSRAPRKVILCLGNAAAWTVTGNYGIKITQERGTVHDTPYAEHTVLALHPAAIMRGTGNYREYKEDFAYAVDLLNGQPRKSVAETHVEVITHHTEVIKPSHFKSPKEQTTHLIDYLNHHQSGWDEIMASDIETTGLNCRRDRIISWGICPTPEKAWIFTEQMIPWLRPLVDNPDIGWCWHNGMFDVGFLRRYNMPVNIDHDTMLMSYSMDERGGPGVHGLETVAKDVLRAPNYKGMLDQYLPTKKHTYADVPFDVLCEYHGLDLGLTKRIQLVYLPRVRRDHHTDTLYHKTLLPAADLLYHVEQQGLYVNWEQQEKNLKTYGAEVEEYANKVREIAEANVNPNAPHDMAWMLFDKFQLRKVKKRSTAKEVLQVLKGHPAVDALIEYRRVAKAYTTYIVNLPNFVEEDNRVHSSYLLHVTPTGRLASRKPNLQNQPRRPELRGQFMAAPGNRYTEVDLSQAELRSLAALSRDPRLVAIYTDNTRSLHKEVALEKFGPNYSKDQYVRAKAVNFGIVYGRTAYTLAQEFKIPVSEAQAMIDSWFRMFPKAKEFIEKCRRTPLTMQVMTTVFGRKKRHGIIAPGNLRALQNEAANFPHQSIASDITLHAAFRCRAQLASMGVKIVNLVHDSILTEHADDIDLSREVAGILCRELEQIPIDWGITTIPFKTDASTGLVWGFLKDYEELGLEPA